MVKRWLICLMWVMAGVEVAEAGAVTFTPKIGTLGLGGEVTVDVAKNKNIRFGYNFAAMNITVLMDEAKVEGELRWQTIPLLLDWHPKGGSFRFTGGVMINNNTVDIKADPTDLIELDGTEYRIISMSGKIDFQPVSPYIGLGFGPAPDAVKDDLKGGGWSFFCDAGVLYQGPPRCLSIRQSLRCRSTVYPEYGTR